MPDAFEALRLSDTPMEPNPAFAARLKTRIARLLGVEMTDLVQPPTSLQPYIAVKNAREAIEWYTRVLGAAPLGEPILMPDGRIGHAELQFGTTVMMLADEPKIGLRAPTSEFSTVTLHLEVENVDATFHRGIQNGAEIEGLPADEFYGRGAAFRDPFGHRWKIVNSVPAPKFINGTREGDLGYVSFEVPDLEKAMAFYSAVLGWTYGPGSSEQGRQVTNACPDTGLWGGQPRGQMIPCWRVDDTVAASERIRKAGGTAGEPNVQPYGTMATCTDDQGDRFYLWQPIAEQAEREAAYTGPRALNGTSHGDVSYMTYEVRDSAKTRAFYQAVLGWQVEPGRIQDGWAVEQIMPMSGISGGHAQATAVPMFRVDDVHKAVEAIRRAGGTASNPVEQHYGLMSDCADNQGTRFYIAQH